MSRISVALLALLVVPAAAAAQRPPASEPGRVELEIRQGESPRASRLGRPVVPPEPQSESAVREAERGVDDLERARRDRKALREQAPQVPRRPDLGYDVYSTIQQRNLMRLLSR